MSFRGIATTVGWTLMGVAGLQLLTALCGLALSEPPAVLAFLLATVLTGFCGGGLIAAFSHLTVSGSRNQEMAVCVLIWLTGILLAAFPIWMLSEDRTVANAVYEAASGLTTSGSTTLARLEDVPRTLVLYRSILEWAGGVVTIVAAITILGPAGVGGLTISRLAHAPGTGTINPVGGALRHKQAEATIGHRILMTSRAVAGLWGMLALACMVALMATGMPVFHAICLSLSTVSTGGFITFEAAGVLHQVPGRDLIVISFAILGAIPFPIIWGLAHARPLERDAFRRETKDFLMFAVLLVILMVLALILRNGLHSALDAVHEGFVIGMSLITTLGLAPHDLSDPVPVPVIVLLLIIGGCTVSTAGGIKIFRMSLLARQLSREMDALAHPSGISLLRYDRDRISTERMTNIWTFFMAFVLFLFATGLLLALTGLDFPSALFHAVAAMTNGGGAIALAPPQIAPIEDLSSTQKYLTAMAMIIGRVEVIAVLVALQVWFRPR